MKKLLNFLLVRRPETENKWWNRLFNVVLFGSGIVVFLLTIFLVINSYNHNWITYNPAVFSFEQNYNEIDSKEIPCTKGLFSCKGIDISKQDESRYWTLYQTAVTSLQKQFGMDKYNYDDCPHTTYQKPINILFDKIFGGNTTADYPTQLIDCVNKIYNDMKANPSYSEYQTAVKNLYDQPSVKITRNIHYGIILTDITLWVVIPIIAVLVWIVFWSAIIYRATLYIIFGKKK